MKEKNIMLYQCSTKMNYEKLLENIKSKHFKYL